MGEYTEQLILHYLPYITEHKKTLIDKVLAKRTRHLTVVLEDIILPQNASAVIRTCDCLGIQDLYVVEKENKYQVNPKVVHGASKWVNICHYNSEVANNLKHCARDLKAAGYRIIGTCPDESSPSIYDLKIDGKLALLFGKETDGLSQEAISYCDGLVHIPMFGFTESFNLSVSVAISLSILTNHLYHSDINWHLSHTEKASLTLDWYRKIVPNYEIMERSFIKKIDKGIEKDFK